MKRWRTLTIFLLLTGCVRFQPRPLSPTDNAARLDARRLDDPGLHQFITNSLGHDVPDWPLKSWDMPMLALAAFYYQPSLDTARAQWREAQAGIKTAAARPNPTLTVTPGYDTSAMNGLNPWLPAVNFDLPLETAGKRGKRKAQAQQLSESARWNLVTAAWQVRSHVRTSLLEYTVARRRTALLEQQSTAQDKLATLLTQRAEAGEISRAELTTARIAVSRARLDLGDAKSRQAIAQAQLAQAIGVPVAALAGLELDFDFSPVAADALTSREARHTALLSRSDIMGALADYAAAEAGLRLEIAKQYPDVHLSPGYQFDQGDDKWTLGLTFDLPILNQNRGPIAEARARRASAAARFTELQAQVIGQVDLAVAEYRAAGEQLKTGAALLAAGEQQQKSVEAQRQAGAADQLDLAGAQIELATATLAQLDSATKRQQALGALEDAVQQPLAGNLISAERSPLRAEDRKKTSTGKESKQ